MTWIVNTTANAWSRPSNFGSWGNIWVRTTTRSRIWNDINTIRPYQIFFSFFIKTNFIIITMIVCLKMLLSVCCDESAIKSLFYRTWEHFGEWFIKRPYNNEINNLIFVRVKIYFSKKFNVRDILNYKIAYLSLWEREEIFYNEIKENFYR